MARLLQVVDLTVVINAWDLQAWLRENKSEIDFSGMMDEMAVFYEYINDSYHRFYFDFSDEMFPVLCQLATVLSKEIKSVEFIILWFSW